MKFSISRKMGVIVSVTLFVTLSLMLIVLLAQEESNKKIKAKENVEQLSLTIQNH